MEFLVYETNSKAKRKLVFKNSDIKFLAVAFVLTAGLQQAIIIHRRHKNERILLCNPNIQSSSTCKKCKFGFVRIPFVLCFLFLSFPPHLTISFILAVIYILFCILLLSYIIPFESYLNSNAPLSHFISYYSIFPFFNLCYYLLIFLI